MSRTVRVKARDPNRKANHLSKIITEFTRSISSTKTGQPVFMMDVKVSKDSYNQSINLIAFDYFTNQCPSYLNEVFELACLNNLRTRNSYLN